MATKPRLNGLLRIAAAISAAALTLTACGQADNVDPETTPGTGATSQPTSGTTEGGSGDDVTTIRFSWWGSDVRHQLNQEMIEVFEDLYPHIEVVPDFIDWSGYWDKLATQTAGGTPPDVIMMDMNYIREYAERGALADLNTVDGIETADIDPALVGAGEFNGGLWALPTGGNILTLVADPQIFEEAGVEFPDDSTWTWEDFNEITAQISANTPDGVYGAQDQLLHDGSLMLLMRQRGHELWTEEGGVTTEVDILTEIFQHKADLVESGSYPPQSVSVEVENGGIEQYLVSTNRGALQMMWSNQLIAVQSASGRDLQLLRYPGESDFERTGSYLKSSMLLSMSATTEHPEEAAFFLNWMQNSTEAGEILLADRGLPSNLKVREHVNDMLVPTDQAAAAFIADVSPTIVDAASVPPIGTGQILQLLQEINEGIGFGQITPEQGAQRFVEEANAIAGG